jgi:hypothetical protein
MAANTSPIFTKNGAIGGANFGTSAANDFDGTSANYATIFTADATNGSRVDRLRLKANGTNVTTVARVFTNNGSSAGTASNNHFIGEIQLPASTSIATAPTSPDVDYIFPGGLVLPPGYKILIGSPTALASGWHATAFGGDY